MRRRLAILFLAAMIELFGSALPVRAQIKVKWFGQSCFQITSPAGVKILLDPFTPSLQLHYPLPEVFPNLVLISHEHFDHNNAAMAKGNPKIIHGLNPATGKFEPFNETIQDVKVYSVESSHDDFGGRERGKNAIMVMEMPGMKIVHLGDLGTLLSEGQVQKIGKVDVLLIPVGGVYTITAEQAGQVGDQLKPKLIIPMHYKTDAITIKLDPVDKFLAGKKNVEKVKGNEYVIKSLPAQPKIIVMDYK